MYFTIHYRQSFNFSKYKQNQVLVQFHRDRKKLYSFVRKCTLNLKDFIYNSYCNTIVRAFLPITTKTSQLIS